MKKILLILAMLTIPLTSIGEIRSVDIIGSRVQQEITSPSRRTVRFYIRNTDTRPIWWMCYTVHLFNIRGEEVLRTHGEWNECVDLIYPSAEPTLITTVRNGFRIPTYEVKIEVTEVVFGEANE